jgi:MFS family permease
MAPGFWIPSLTNVLKAQGLEGWVGIIFAMIPICSLITPLVGGALADEKLSAQKLMAWCSLLSALGICFAYGALDFGLGPVVFLCGLVCYSLLSGPTWGLLATLSISNLSHGDKRYPSVRLGATLGWMAAGFATSHLLHADSSLLCGYAAALARICAGLIAFTIPNTPPLGQGKSWRNALGLGAFSLFRNRNHAVLLGVSGLFSIPLTAFYMYSGEFFQILGDRTPSATMTTAQWSEIIAMLMLGSLMQRYHLKTLLMWGLGLSVLRFSLSGYAGFSGMAGWHLAGISLHGLCYTIYFVTAQVYLDRRVEPELRGQAQGMLGLMTSGVGPLIGAFFCAWLRALCVDENGHGWQYFWWCLAIIIALCWICFGLLYRSQKRELGQGAQIGEEVTHSEVS